MNLLHRKIYEEIKKRILQGDFDSSDKLPSTRVLAKTFGVSRNPILWALRELERDGLIEKFAGSGVFIKKNKELFADASPALAANTKSKRTILSTRICWIMSMCIAGEKIAVPLQRVWKKSRQ